MNKPDWKDAPGWAQWLAQDKDGEYCWWNIQPDQTASLWTQGKNEEDFIYKSAGYYPKCVLWMCSLESRPQ